MVQCGGLRGAMSSDPATADGPPGSPLKLSLSLSILAGLNLIATFAFQWLPVHLLGVGPNTDALFFSAIVPTIVLSVAASGLTSVLTPMLAISDALEFRRRAWTFAHAVGAAALAVNGLLFLASPVLVHWLAPGFDLATRALAVDLVRIQLVGGVFTALLTVNWSSYYASHRFIWVEVSALIASAIGLSVLKLTIASSGVYGVAWAMTLRAALQTALLVRGLGRYTLPDWKSGAGGTVLRRLAPIVGGSIYFKTDPLVERFLASFAPAGQLSLLHLASQLYAAANQIVTKALINPIMPRLARMASAADWPAFWQLTTRRLTLVVSLTIGASIGLALLRHPIAEALGGGGRLSASETTLLATLLVAMAGVWLGGASGQVSTTSFFAYGNTRLPTIVGVVGYTLGVPLKAFLFWKWGVVGIAIGGSIYTVGNAIAHQLLLRRQVLGFETTTPEHP